MIEGTDVGVTLRAVDERMRARPRVAAVVYFLVLSTAWAVAVLHGDESVTVGVLLGCLFGLLYVALAWFWGDLGDGDAAE